MQEWSYIPVGGSLPNTEQRNLAFGAAASMVHPATGKKKKELNPCSYSFKSDNSFLPLSNRLLSSQITVRGSKLCFCNCIYIET